MKTFLAIMGVLILLLAIGMFFASETVLQQTCGATLGVLGAVLFSTAAILEGIENIPKNQARHDAMIAKMMREAQATLAAQDAEAQRV